MKTNTSAKFVCVFVRTCTSTLVGDWFFFVDWQPNETPDQNDHLWGGGWTTFGYKNIPRQFVGPPFLIYAREMFSDMKKV